MLLKPNAKINLGLYITSKREDGYHNLESLFLPIAWEDELRIDPSTEFQFLAEGLTIEGNPNNNLVVKAYQLMKERYQISEVRIHLKKQIPMGAGLGGGSSDAAFTLKGLNQLFDLKISTSELEEMAAELGSDCVFFIQNKPALVQGRGELLKHNIDFQLKSHILLVKPEVFISTAAAFSQVKPKAMKENLIDILKQPKQQWQTSLKNDFEESVFPQFPELSELKMEIENLGAYYTAMSGSGSCLFGLFNEKPEIPESFKKHQVHLTEIAI